MLRQLVRVLKFPLVDILILLGVVATYQRTGEASVLHSIHSPLKEARMSSQQLSVTSPTHGRPEAEATGQGSFGHVACVSPVEVNFQIMPQPGQMTDTSTTRCHRRKAFGGTAVGCARQLARLEILAKPVFLVGNDDQGRLARTPLLQEFPEAVVLPLLTETHETYHLGNERHAVAVSVASRQALLPKVALQPVVGAKLTVDANVDASDGPFLGTLAAMFVRDQPPEDAVKWALATAAMHTNGTGGEADRGQIAAEMARRPTVSAIHRQPRPLVGERTKLLLATTGSGLVGIGLGWLLGSSLMV